MDQQPVSSELTHNRRWLVRLFVTGLLIVHAGLILDCAYQDSATFDEIGNLSAGLSYYQTGTYDLYNVNPPISKLSASLPVWLSAPNLSALHMPRYPGDRPEWDVGDQFARANADRYHTFIVRARLMGIVWSVLGALGIYHWAKLLWGVPGGLVALAAWCFEPNIIAHAHLINADLPATTAGIWAAFAFRYYILQPSWKTTTLAGLSLGVAITCKFTMLVFCPLWVILWAWLVLIHPTPYAAQLSRWSRVGQFMLLVGASLYVVNISYEGTGTCRQLNEYKFVSITFAGPQVDWTNNAYGNRFANSFLGEIIVPFPDNFLSGIDVQRRDFEGRRVRYSYLGGEWRQSGWWYYYLYGTAVKIPLGLWGIFVLSLLVPFLIKPAARLDWRELLLLCSPGLVVFVFVSSQTSFQSHLRYILPAIPFWIIFLGRVGVVFESGTRWLRLLTCTLLSWAILSYLLIHPHSLAYFNEFGGGPDHGHDHLLGSNIDWGQDLLRLKEWLDAHPEAKPIRFAYFNHIDPRVAGIRFKLPPYGYIGPPPEDLESGMLLGPHPGYYAISVRIVHGNQVAAPDGQGQYRYFPPHSLVYFQRFRPIAKAGYSIFIYHISLEESNRVRAEYGLPLLPIDWQKHITR